MIPWSSEVGVKVPVSEMDPAPESLQPQDHRVQGSAEQFAPNEGEMLQREGTDHFVGYLLWEPARVGVLRLTLNNVIQQMGLHALHQAAWLPTSGRVGWWGAGERADPLGQRCFSFRDNVPITGQPVPTPSPGQWHVKHSPASQCTV